MTDPSLISLFVRPLNQLRIPYMVTGGVASVIYGEPMFTPDIDLVIELKSRDALRFANVWSTADFYVPPVEVIKEESRRVAYGIGNSIGGRRRGAPQVVGPRVDGGLRAPVAVVRVSRCARI